MPQVREPLTLPVNRGRKPKVSQHSQRANRPSPHADGCPVLAGVESRCFCHGPFLSLFDAEFEHLFSPEGGITKLLQARRETAKQDQSHLRHQELLEKARATLNCPIPSDQELASLNSHARRRVTQGIIRKLSKYCKVQSQA